MPLHLPLRNVRVKEWGCGGVRGVFGSCRVKGGLKHKLAYCRVSFFIRSFFAFNGPHSSAVVGGNRLFANCLSVFSIYPSEIA